MRAARRTRPREGDPPRGGGGLPGAGDADGRAFVGDAALTVATLLSTVVIAVVGHPLIPARLHGPTTAAAYAGALGLVLLVGGSRAAR